MQIYENRKQDSTKKKEEPSKIINTKNTGVLNLTGIPDHMKETFENFTGFSFHDVRVHYNSDKPAQLMASAFTQGNQVYISPGQEKYLSHELGHVVQQKQGLVRPTRVINGMPVNDSVILEQQADTVALHTNTGTKSVCQSSLVVQRKPYTPKEIVELARKINFTITEDTPLTVMLSKIGTDFFNEVIAMGMAAFNGCIDGAMIGCLCQGIVGSNSNVGWGGGAAVIGSLVETIIKACTIRPAEKVQDLLLLAKQYKADEWTMEQLPLLFCKGLIDKYNVSDVLSNELTKKSFIDIKDRLKTPKNKKSLLDNMSALLPICGEKGVKSAVEGAMIFVSRNYLFGEYLNKISENNEENELLYENVFTERFNAITKFIMETYQKLDPKTQKNYWIISTGSDPHIENYHVLFLKNKTNENDIKVYKPRSLKIDDAMTGSNGLLTEVNARLTADEKLPVLSINHIDTGSDQETGIESFVNKKDTFTKEEAKKYYFQMGLLDIYAQYMGLGDLHQDNIIPTQEGPVAIDAEVGLFAGSSLINNALNQSFTAINEEASAVFEIIDNGKNTSSTIAFEYGTNNEYKDEYKDEYEKGKKRMTLIMERLMKNQSYIKKLRNLTSNVTTRIVPIATNELAQLHTNTINKNDSEFGYMFSQWFPNFKNNICECFTYQNSSKSKAPYFIKNNQSVTLTENIYVQLLFDSLKKNNIPCFEVKMPPNDGNEVIKAKLLLDKQQFGWVDLLFRY